ncbi:MAG: UDP-3-O-(3-hydroxymyristoyl)glucosamine N-acyltransferase [Candidatus Thioglobus sp.]|uniref:UDP-3-O-(3-hydroxymyristoyl)glucosamine N-acyltransferase n=1 Tax=Candidatus Thioglobus sp. TaxID=2026721 RepID=UPI0026322241|nr:UDP-3-O-(3-hydroxymyristoyl)glucosamine N-acyltransferase [Candidatus Thioglobus sp.]MDC9726822.1 UDP-3-O-(3-hydroxymyristoyl)glucosamine N-acyltransferase [Candidatus Thioglobus sp.]
MRTLGEIAILIDAELIGDANYQILGLASIDQAQADQLSYVASNKYSNQLDNTQAGAVIINKSLKDSRPANALIVKDAPVAFAKLSQHFRPENSLMIGIHPSVTMGKNVQIGDNCTIGVNVVLEDEVIIGNNVTIGANSVIHHQCQVGNDVVIDSGVVIGSEGFGNARDNQQHWHAIAHLGRVIINNQVTIGANTAIDRGTLGDTIIHNGVRLDNLIHIAHNVIIGEDTAIAACSGIAGSTKIGERCMIGGMVGIVGHLNICDDVIINAKSTVDKNINSAGMYTGIMPLMPHKKWQIVGVWLTKLDKITKYLNIKLNYLKGK